MGLFLFNQATGRQEHIRLGRAHCAKPEVWQGSLYKTLGMAGLIVLNLNHGRAYCADQKHGRAHSAKSVHFALIISVNILLIRYTDRI